MFAVLKTGGKQYKVAKDDTLTIERIFAEPGEAVQFNDILMLGGDKVTVGAPMVDGAAVQAEVLDQIRGPKLINYVKRRRKHSSQRKKGHRQYLTTVKITEILEKGADKTGVKAAIGTGSVSAAALAAADSAAAKKKADAKPKAKKEAAPKPKAKAETAEKKADAKPKAKEEAPKAAAGAKPANLLDAPQGEKDDLKKISGVGPKLEDTLNSQGVYHFWQIAEWKKADIAMMDDLLSFKGRIERDDWIKQAKELAKG